MAVEAAAPVGAAVPRLVFLGTGASGGTPGEGRSKRLESSMLATCDAGAVLVDVGRGFAARREEVGRIDAVILTHGHADAIGGLAALGDWRREQGSAPLPVYAAAATIDAACRRFARLDHCDFRAVTPRERLEVAGWTVSPTLVPHARDPDRFPTYAWKLDRAGRAVVYASDLARPTPELEDHCRGVDVLVVDGATYARRIFTHLRIDVDLPQLCRWDVGRIYLTQIGRSAPVHDELVEIVRRLCPRAAPAYDGFETALA